MKKLLCLLLAALILPAGAFAVDLTRINEYLAIFGEEELEGGTFDGKYTVFQEGSCRIWFRELEDDLIIYVDGGGESFLPVCMAAAMSLEEDNSGFSYNAGAILTNYLFARTGEERSFMSDGQNLLSFIPTKTGCAFAVNRK